MAGVVAVVLCWGAAVGLWAVLPRESGGVQVRPAATKSSPPTPKATESLPPFDTDDMPSEGFETQEIEGPNGTFFEVPRNWNRFDESREPDVVSYESEDSRASRLIIFTVAEATPSESIKAASDSDRITKGGYDEPFRGVVGGIARREFTYSDEELGEQFAVDCRFEAETDGNLYAIVAFGPVGQEGETRQVVERAKASFRTAE